MSCSERGTRLNALIALVAMPIIMLGKCYNLSASNGNIVNGNTKESVVSSTTTLLETTYFLAENRLLKKSVYLAKLRRIYHNY